MLAGKATEGSTRINGGSTPIPASERSALANIELFIGTAELIHIEQACRYRRFSADEQIIDRDAVCSDVFFIVRGRARVVAYSVSGHEITFADPRAVFRGSRRN